MAHKESVEDFFAGNYAGARQKFVRACEKQGLEVESYILDSKNHGEDELATDVVRIGDTGAGKLLVLTSGVHGAELMCGSGCQVAMLEQNSFKTLPGDTAVVLIHAINPWGASHLRRNNEDNIDLCRNFVDFAGELPLNQDYENIHGLLSCPELEGSRRDEARKNLNRLKSDVDPSAFVNAIMSGQYSHPDGMAYGGRQACWSHRTLKNVLQHHAKSAEKVCLIDYHSGLGAYGHGSVVCMHEGKALQRAQRWFGRDLMAPMNQQQSSQGKFHPALGHTTQGYLDALPDCELTSIVLEYGTHDMDTNLQALLDDHALFLNGDTQSTAGQGIKAQMLETHFPDDPQWRYAVWTRSQELLNQALGGLHSDR